MSSRCPFYTSHNLFGILENTLFHKPVKMLARPRSKSLRNSEITEIKSKKLLVFEKQLVYWRLSEATEIRPTFFGILIKEHIQWCAQHFVSIK